jgi:large subunit ribosomal protein L35
MPKMKTRKSAAKRFKITGTGKYMRKQAGLRHLASCKNAKRKRRLGKDQPVHASDLNRLKMNLPYGL